MSMVDDSTDNDQFQDSGGLLGRLSSLANQFGAGLQGWAQTPAGNPFAGIANGITAFNNAQPPDGSFIGPPAPPSSPTQPQDFGDRFGAAFQSWAHTPVGNPFAALANGINAFNAGQPNLAGGRSPAWPTQTQDADAQPNPNPVPPVTPNPAPLASPRPVPQAIPRPAPQVALKPPVVNPAPVRRGPWLGARVRPWP